MLGRWLRARERQRDKKVTFPMLRAEARDIEGYRAAVQFIIEHDRAWRYPEEWKEEQPELYSILEEGK